MGVSVLEGKVAVEKAERGVLGHLLWFTIYESLSVTMDDLVAAFQAAGVPSDFLPRKVKPCDAFRRATSAVEKRRMMGRSGGQYRNLLVAEVRSDGKEIERQLVLQEVDADDREVFHDVAARVILERDSGTLRVERLVSEPEVEAALARVEENYRQALTRFTARHIRDILHRMLYAVKATEVRPSGGVYFVPVRYESDVQAMRNLLRTLKQEFFAVPLVDSADSRDMVAEKFRQQVSEILAQFAVLLSDQEVKKGELMSALSRARDLFSAVEEYQALLEADLRDLLARVDLAKRQVLVALQRMSAA